MPTFIDREDLPVEMRLLLALSRPVLNPVDVERCQALLAAHQSSFDFGFFIDQAGRHGVLPLVGRNIVRHRVWYADSGASQIPYAWIYGAAYQSNRVRNIALGDEFGRLFRAFNERGMRYAIRKGPTLGEHIYQDIGVRRMSDLDVLVRRADVKQFGAALTELGYAQGRADRAGTRVLPFDRRTHAYWRINLNNQLPWIKIAHRDDVEQFQVDLCLELFQPRSGIEIPVDEILGRSTALHLCGERSVMLAIEDQLLDLCLHLNKEATALAYINEGKDLQLLRFLDVAEVATVIGEAGDWSVFVSRVTGYNATESVYYALHFTDLLYPGRIPAHVLDALRPDDLSFLDEYGRHDGSPSQWPDAFLIRLFDPHRRNSVTAVTSVPWS